MKNNNNFMYPAKIKYDKNKIRKYICKSIARGHAFNEITPCKGRIYM